MSSIEVHHAPDEGRYEITVDGELVGFAQYRDEGTRRIFPHTEIATEHEGNGLGSRVVGVAVEETRAAGLEIVALCPFVAAYLDRRPTG